MAKAQDQIETYTDDRSPSQIKSEIERTRARMDQAVNALTEQLRPRRLLDEFLDLFRGSEFKTDARRVARKAARKTLEKVKEHPIPSALAGAGLAYLIFLEGQKEKEVKRRYAGVLGGPAVGESSLGEPEFSEAECPSGIEAQSSVTSYVSGQMREEPERSGPGFTDKAKDKLAGTTESVKGAAAGAAESMKSTAGKLKDTAADTAQQVKETAVSTAQKVKSTSRATAGKVKDVAAGTAGKVKDSAVTAAAKVKDAAAGTAASVRQTASGMAHKMGDAASVASAKVGALANRARDLSHNVRTSAAEAGHMVRVKAGDMGHRVQRGYAYSRDQAAEMADEHPLALGTALAGLGVLIGLALPRTRREDELLGEKADRLKNRAKGTGREIIDRGMHAAQITAEETIDEAKRQGLTPSAIAQKAKHLASELKGAASEAAQREELTPEQIADKAKAVAGHAKETARQELGQQKNLQESNV